MTVFSILLFFLETWIKIYWKRGESLKAHLMDNQNILVIRKNKDLANVLKIFDRVMKD